MQYLISSKEMKKYDAYTINQIGIPVLVLMERAALAAVENLQQNEFDLKKVAIICGYGNNGGDGVAVARLLKLQQVDVTVYFIGDSSKITDSTLQQQQIAEKYQVNIQPLPETLTNYTTIIDALFGVGLSRPVQGEYAAAIEKINQSGAAILAIDIPSGICADNGQVLGVAIKAKHTVTFAYKKLGMVLYPGCEYCGIITIKDIGINEISFANKPPAVYSYNQTDLLSLMPHRANYSNKGSFGKVLVIAGSATMSGAAYFSAKSAYKTGCGLVKIYTNKTNQTILLGQLPEAILATYDPANIDNNQLTEAISWASVIVIGPGMGTEKSTYSILSQVIKQANVPLIIDADGLNILANNIELLADHKQPIIITPHLGEMARLTAKTITEISKNLLKEATVFAKQHNLICVLKDARTIVANQSEQRYVNQSGNNGMATAGAGDVLTGVIAGLIAQHCSPELAATLGVYLHGLAGNKAKQDSNQYSMTAEDIINGLVKALSNINN